RACSKSPKNAKKSDHLLTCCSAKGLTFGAPSLSSAHRNDRLGFGRRPFPRNAVVVPSSGAATNRAAPLRGFMSFSQLGLSDKVLAAVQAAGYTTPTPIQSQAIPHVLARRDVLGIAQTGTGKTAAFVLPMLTKLEQGRARARMPRTLILEPTRELAAQVAAQVEEYGKDHQLKQGLSIGG